MSRARADRVEWEWVDPNRIVDVHDLVTDAHRALKSGAAGSWGAEQRRVIADTLDRARALMRELARLSGYEEGDDDAIQVELVHRRGEPLAGMKALEQLAGTPETQGQSR